MKNYTFYLYLTTEGKINPSPFTYKAKSNFLAYCKLTEDPQTKNYFIPTYINI